MMWNWGWGWGMGIGMIAFWAVVAAVIWALVRGAHAHAPYEGHTHEPHDVKPSAEDVLAERFARGEISAEEYAERKQILAKR